MYPGNFLLDDTLRYAKIHTAFAILADAPHVHFPSLAIASGCWRTLIKSVQTKLNFGITCPRIESAQQGSILCMNAHTTRNTGSLYNRTTSCVGRVRDCHRQTVDMSTAHPSRTILKISNMAYTCNSFLCSFIFSLSVTAASRAGVSRMCL